MKFKIKQKIFSLIFCLLMMCLLTACASKETIEDADDKNITIAPTLVEEPTNPVVNPDDTNEETDITDDNIKEPTVDPVEVPNIEYFSSIKEYFIDYAFDVSYDEDLDYQDVIYSIQGSYDLNGDGQEDEIEAVLGWHDSTNSSYIKVNGIKKSFYTDSPTGEAYIIDMDSKDNFVEVAVFDDGPSGDPIYDFFRYDGNELYNIGSIDEFALMDGQGKFISSFSLSLYFKPKFFSSWDEIKNNSFVSTSQDIEDIEKYIGKSYELNGTGYFIPLEENPEEPNEYIVWEHETLREFNDEKIKLLDIYMMSQYYVELEDGEKGLLYFWIGD